MNELTQKPIINHYNYRELKGKFVVSTDAGVITILEKEEFDKLKKEEFDKNLEEKLLKTGVLINKKNVNEIVKKIQKKNSFLFNGVSLHIMVLTLRCDMKCVYCQASSTCQNGKGYDLDEETAKKTVDFIFQSPNSNINIEFQGGEPLLNFEILKKTVEYAKKKNKKYQKNLIFSLVSNMTLMTEKIMDWLIDNRVGVCTSLDGPKELHNKNRISQDGKNYENVVKWIKKFNEKYEKINFGKMNALVTLTKESLKYPTEIIDEYVNLGVENIHLRFLNSLGYAKKTWDKIYYDEHEFLEYWNKALD